MKNHCVYLSSYYVNKNFDDSGKTDISRNLYDGYFLQVPLYNTENKSNDK
jgi:hypothetical protein